MHSTGYNAWLNMHKCPFIIKHSLTSKAVGTVHAHVKSDVTWVDYVLYISSYEVISQLKE